MGCGKSEGRRPRQRHPSGSLSKEDEGIILRYIIVVVLVTIGDVIVLNNDNGCRFDTVVVVACDAGYTIILEMVNRVVETLAVGKSAGTPSLRQDRSAAIDEERQCIYPIIPAIRPITLVSQSDVGSLGRRGLCRPHHRV